MIDILQTDKAIVMDFVHLSPEWNDQCCSAEKEIVLSKIRFEWSQKMTDIQLLDWV